jgi:hypothetical protein
VSPLAKLLNRKPWRAGDRTKALGTDWSSCYVSVHQDWSAEMTPVSSNDEKHACEDERNASDDRSRSRHLEGWDLSGDEPGTGKQDQQESDLGERDARLMA